MLLFINLIMHSLYGLLHYYYKQFYSDIMAVYQNEKMFSFVDTLNKLSSKSFFKENKKLQEPTH